MNGLRFASLFSVLGLSRRKASAIHDPEPETIQLSRNGWVPNSERLPVLLYRHVIEPGPKRRAAPFEERFGQNGWKTGSRNGVYDFHHFHSTTHEALGLVTGEARIMLGGEGGREVTMRAGDVAVLPAGTGHRLIEGSPDLLIMGAYPSNMDWDICRTAPDEKAMERMRRIPLPKSDPLGGVGGYLPRLWRQG
jgi:uncharacterized protein YjlB